MRQGQRISGDKIIQVLREKLPAIAPPGLVSVYLFGSHAAGRAHRESDVDIAVLLEHAVYPSARERFEVRVRFGTEVGVLLGFGDVDVVVLNDAAPHFGRHVVTSGVRIFCADRGSDHAFARYIQSRAADLTPFLRRMRALKLKALVR